MEKKKRVDAVAVVRAIRDAHYEQLKEKSVAERLAFYRSKSQALRADLKAQRARTEE